MTQPLEFGWFLPTNGDTTSFTKPVEVRQSSEMFERVTMAAEAAGFEYMLIPVQTACWEAWISGAMMVARSKRIKMLIAARPGYINPVLLAKMISTFDQLSGGRILINLIAGASDEEARAESIQYSKEERYQVMAEEVEILKQLWTQSGPSDYMGQFYDLRQAQIRPRVLQQPHPPFYLGGGSKQAWDMSAKHADVHLFWGDHPQRIATQIEVILDLARNHGRAERMAFGMRLQIICRENEHDAWDAAHSLIEGASEKHLEMIRSMFSVSEANRRMREFAESTDHMIAPNLWSGITTVRPGAGVAVVGDPEQCAATLQSFIDVGCSSFCLSGYLHHDEARRFGDWVRPIVAANNPGRLPA